MVKFIIWMGKEVFVKRGMIFFMSGMMLLSPLKLENKRNKFFYFLKFDFSFLGKIRIGEIGVIIGRIEALGNARIGVLIGIRNGRKLSLKNLLSNNFKIIIFKKNNFCQ